MRCLRGARYPACPIPPLPASHPYSAYTRRPVVTGAPPTDLISFYYETYPGTGTLQQGIMEVGQVRMKQFFDHYLMDKPEPKWMSDGVPQVDKGVE